MTREEAYKLRKIVEQASSSLDDKIASEGVSLFPRLKNNGELIKVNTRINWNGALKRAAVDLWDTETNNPDNAPSLWQDIYYKNGIRVIAGDIPATEPFMKDELAYEGEALYKSLLDNNVWKPSAYPQGWEIITE